MNNLYMKKHVLLIAFLLLAVLVRAQVVMNLQLPPAGLTLKPQLWNLSLVNTGNSDLEVSIEMVMTDIASNQRVLSATTRPILLNKGARQLQAKDLVPIVYNPGSSGIVTDPNPEGFLPVGVFSVCYTVIMNLHGEIPQRIGEACETVEIEPLSPPQLVSPADGEATTITRPFFTWIPPAPANLFRNLQYDWVLTEVLYTQSPADAIQQNIPLLTRQNISFTNFQYPMSSPELDTGKLYAWRVTAKSNMMPVANSEVWSFRVTKDSIIASKESDGYFARLHVTEDAAYSICTGTLRFEYLNEINSNTIDLKIFDISSPVRKEMQLDSTTQTVRPGQNFIALKLDEIANLSNTHMYLLEVKNVKQEKWYLKFEYRK